MSELSTVERLQPSLLDRLIDDDPQSRTEATSARFLSRAALRAAVLRELRWLFNTTDLNQQIDATLYPHVSASVLNYGLPCLAGNFTSALDVDRLRAAIRQAILRFEPRIVASSLEITLASDHRTADQPNRIDLVIRGLLWSQPLPLEIALRTQIDLEEGGVTITDMGS